MKLDDLPSPNEFWARPNLRMTGDSDADSIYLAVGKSLSTWESLEQLFAHLYGIFIGTESAAALRAFGCITSAGGRRDAIRESGAVFFFEKAISKDISGKLQKLLDHFGNAAGKRNDIGHGIVGRLPQQYKADGFFLMPPEYVSNRNKFLVTVQADELINIRPELLHHVYRYISADIYEFERKVKILYEVTLDYGNAVAHEIRHTKV